MNESVSLYTCKLIVYCTTTNKVYNEMRTMTTSDEKIEIIKKAIEHSTNGIGLFTDMGYTLSYIEGVTAGEIGDIAEHIMRPQ